MLKLVSIPSFFAIFWKYILEVVPFERDIEEMIPFQFFFPLIIFYVLYSFTFSRMSHSWQHAVYNHFQTSLFT